MARIKLKHVNIFNNKNRPNLTPRGYFRKPGCKAIRLPGLPFSEEFMAAYRAALDGLPVEPTKVEIGRNQTKTGTIAALVALLLESAEHWTSLSAPTQDTYRKPIEGIREKYGHCPVATLQPKHIKKMLDDCPLPSTKRKLLKCIRLLMKVAVPSMRPDDPSAGFAVKLVRTKGHHAWTPNEIAQFRSHWALGTVPRLVLEFALQTYSRRSEVMRLGPQHVYESEDGGKRIRIARSHGSDDVDIAVTPELQAAIEAMPKPKHLTYLVGRGGNKPMGSSTLAHLFAGWATEAALPNKCRLHGLKKAGMNRLVKAGCSPHEQMALSGHRSLSMVQHYTQEVEREVVGDNATAKLLARNAKRAARRSAKAAVG